MSYIEDLHSENHQLTAFRQAPTKAVFSAPLATNFGECGAIRVRQDTHNFIAPNSIINAEQRAKGAARFQSSPLPLIMTAWTSATKSRCVPVVIMKLLRGAAGSWRVVSKSSVPSMTGSVCLHRGSLLSTMLADWIIVNKCMVIADGSPLFKIAEGGGRGGGKEFRVY